MNTTVSDARQAAGDRHGDNEPVDLPGPKAFASDTWWLSACLEYEFQGRRLHNYNSCFLVVGKDATVLVDTGLPLHWATLRGQLLQILDGRPLDFIFPTHPESPHMGNAGVLMELFPNATLIGDLRNCELYLPRMTHRFRHVKVGDSLDLGGRRLIFVRGAVHDLPNTLWAYDTLHGVLFVSDAYPYAHEHEAHLCGMTSDEIPEDPRPEDTAPVIEGALGWTRHVDPELIIADVDSVLKEFRPSIIAPAHGAVVMKPAVVTGVFKEGLRRVGPQS